jgi:acetyltransferase
MKHIVNRDRSRHSRYIGCFFEFADSLSLFDDSSSRQQERKEFAKDRSLLSIRSIRPQDASRLAKFYNGLSRETIHLRFLSCFHSVPQEWTEKLTRTNDDSDVALVAVEGSPPDERILGECRIVRQPGSTRGEVAVVVSDCCQGKGIGTMLLEDCIRIAQELGTTPLWGLVSAENTRALSLAKKFGFSIHSDFPSDTLEVELALVPGH